MALFFISDLHLSPEQPALAQGFKDFLTDINQQANALYILGDFFDSWIGDDEDHPFVQAIKDQLSIFSQQGHALYIQRGNRDFLMGEKFAADIGGHLLGDEALIEIAGQKVLLMHGDSLCTADTEYMKFRAMVRGTAWQSQILAMPIAARRQLAQDLRSKSHSMNVTKAEDIMDVSQDEVENVMRKHRVNTLIHGHTHRPAVHHFMLDGLQSNRFVLGDWGKTAWYIKADGKLELIEFPV